MKRFLSNWQFLATYTRIFPKSVKSLFCRGILESSLIIIILKRRPKPASLGAVGLLPSQGWRPSLALLRILSGLHELGSLIFLPYMSVGKNKYFIKNKQVKIRKKEGLMNTCNECTNHRASSFTRKPEAKYISL